MGPDEDLKRLRSNLHDWTEEVQGWRAALSSTIEDLANHPFFSQEQPDPSTGSTIQSMSDSVSRPELDARFEALRADMRADAEGLRREMSEMRGDLRAGMESLRADFHKTGTDSARWILATAIGMIVGFGGLFLSMASQLRKEAAASSPTVSTQPAPIIINVPSAAPPAAPASR